MKWKEKDKELEQKTRDKYKEIEKLEEILLAEGPYEDQIVVFNEDSKKSEVSYFEEKEPTIVKENEEDCEKFLKQSRIDYNIDHNYLEDCIRDKQLKETDSKDRQIEEKLETYMKDLNDTVDQKLNIENRSESQINRKVNVKVAKEKHQNKICLEELKALSFEMELFNYQEIESSPVKQKELVDTIRLSQKNPK